MKDVMIRKQMSALLLTVILLIVCERAKAQYSLKDADTQYDLLNYTKAIDLYERAYRQKNTLHAAERLAACYSAVQNYKEAESWYAIASNMPGSGPENILSYAKALQNNSKYSEAKIAYSKYAMLNHNVTLPQ